MNVGDEVWKAGGLDSYAGPGKVVAVFKNWMGQPRYVVGHQIDGGRGWMYCIYDAKQLEPPRKEPIHDGG